MSKTPYETERRKREPTEERRTLWNSDPNNRTKLPDNPEPSEAHDPDLGETALEFLRYFASRATDQSSVDNAVRDVRNHLSQPAPAYPELLSRDDALVVLDKAINHPFGRSTDDKVVLSRLMKKGYWIAAAPSRETTANERR